MADKLTFGQRITALRNQQHRSAAEVARAAGIDKSTLCRIELGHQRNPKTSTVTALARVYGLTPGQLLGSEPLPRRGAAGTAGPLPTELRDLIRELQDAEHEMKAAMRSDRRELRALTARVARLERQSGHRARRPA